MSDDKTKPQLRSSRWLDGDTLRNFGHRSRLLQIGLDPEDWSGKPVIAVINTWSEINQCHIHLRERAKDVKKGVLQAGGLPIEMPVHSFSETFLKPTSMLYRNLGAMETEEILRAQPFDGAVLMGGCDKSTPGLLMGALSVDLPSIYVPAGPMLRGNWQGRTLGSGSDAWKYWDERRAGNISDQEWSDIEAGIARSYGHCMTMGTASTMTSMAEVMGLTLPGAASIPAADVNHNRMCTAAGRRIVEMVRADLRPSRILTRESFENAIAATMAIGGSTNSIVHLIAMARRAGVDLSLADFERISQNVPVIANVRPSGDSYLMEDFYYAGGLRALLARIADRLHGDCRTVNGRTLTENLDGAKVHNDDVIRPLDNPVYASGALAVLHGNLAPDGCVMKVSACDPRFLDHTGPALVFDSYPEMKDMIDRDDLDVTPDTVLILRNAGPQGGPGMPEWGMLPLPRKLVERGVRDMLRISDARMSGTSYGACVLHVAPESFVGGPLALVRTGDPVRIDVKNRRLDMVLPDDEIAARKAAWAPPKPHYERGYGWLFVNHIGQADQGCDFDFLTREFGAPAGEPAIF